MESSSDDIFERKANVNCDKEIFLEAIRSFMKMETLDALLIKQLIEKIEVFPVQGCGKERTQKVIIHYRFVGIVHIPEQTRSSKRPVKLNTRQGVEVEYQTTA